jgi:hypothetical protein
VRFPSGRCGKVGEGKDNTKKASSDFREVSVCTWDIDLGEKKTITGHSIAAGFCAPKDGRCRIVVRVCAPKYGCWLFAVKVWCERCN